MEFATFCYATNFALYFWKRLFSVIRNCSEIFACRVAARTSISALIHSFLFRCVSQPPPLRGTSFHRKEGEPHPRAKTFPAWEGSDARVSFPQYRHFERKRETFFVGGQTVYACERKREACLSTDREYGVSCKRISRAGEEEDCNKDPSAALGMTIREEG